MFCIVDNNEIVFGPTPWSKYVFQLKLQELYDFANELPDNPTIGLMITSSVKVLPVEYNSPSYNEKIQQLVGPFHMIEDTKVIGTYQIGDKNVDSVQHELLGRCANVRWEKETQGLTMTIQSKQVFISTSREDRDTFLRTYQVMNDTINWKFADDWLTLTKLEVKDIVDAVFNHVQNSFQWEQDKQTEITTASTLLQLDLIDIS